MTDEEQAELERRRAYDAIQPAPAMERIVYPDGSERVGAPPFPDLSPLQEAAMKGIPPQPRTRVVGTPEPADMRPLVFTRSGPA